MTGSQGTYFSWLLLYIEGEGFKTDKKVVINQCGVHNCSVCENKFNWRLKVEILCIDEFEEKYGTIVSRFDAEPDKYVDFKLVNDEKIVVNIICPKCGCMSETERIPKFKEVCQ